MLAKLGKDKVDAIITAACETLEKAGYFAGFYMNYDWYKNKCNGADLAKRFTCWIARWTKEEQTAYPMWQFGGETNYIRTNKVAGVTCDQDYCYVDFPNIIKARGKNGFVASKPVEVQPVEPVKPVEVKPIEQPSYSTYTVKKGDGLIKIGQKLGKDWKRIASDNNIKAPKYTIYAGQVLKIYK